MSDAPAFQAPPFCPNPRCKFHGDADEPWAWVRAGFFRRATAPHRVQRFRCDHCGRYFSEQTFRTTYWLKRPELLLPVAEQLVQCAALRQIARPLHASPQTIALHAARIARHCLLFHQTLRPRGPHPEPLVLDGFQSFESSQYHPTWFHLVAGQRSHFFHGFTDSELRRSGAMSPAQRRRRAEIEAARAHGIEDIERIFTTQDLAPGEVIVAATGVSNGDLLRGVRFLADSARTHSLVMCTRCNWVRFVDGIHFFARDRREEVRLLG